MSVEGIGEDKQESLVLHCVCVCGVCGVLFCYSGVLCVCTCFGGLREERGQNIPLQLLQVRNFIIFFT